jgi:hypothetical protein
MIIDREEQNKAVERMHAETKRYSRIDDRIEKGLYIFLILGVILVIYGLVTHKIPIVF